MVQGCSAERDRAALELFREYRRTGSPELRHRLVLVYRDLAKAAAVFCVRQYPPFDPYFKELRDEGVFLLYTTVDAYDPDRETATFRTYYLRSFRKSVHTFMYRDFRLVGVKYQGYRLVRAYRAAVAADDMPRTFDEVCDGLRLNQSSRKTLRAALAVVNASWCGDSAGDDDPSLGQLLAGADDESAAVGAAEEVAVRVAKLLQGTALRERELEVLRLRYGLSGRPPLSLQEIADRIAVPYMTVKNLHTRAIIKLRKTAGIG